MLSHRRLVLLLTVLLVAVSLSHRVAAQSCGEVAAPACDGVCPPTEACVPGEFGCECVPATDPCGFMAADEGPGCYGSCVEGFRVCSDMMVGGELDCVCIPEFTPTPTSTPPATATATPTPTDTPEPTATPTSTVLTPTPTPIPCVGDCNNDGQVTVDEIVRAVNIALGISFISTCPEIDSNGDGQATVDEILQAVNNALNGCD